jgi:hypothetical protein
MTVNKNVGTMVGGLAVAAALFRPVGSVSNPPEPPGNPTAATALQAGKKSSGEGPWVASCDY